MESINTTASSGRMSSTIQGDTDKSLDSLARELARKKPKQRKKDEPQREQADALPLLSLQQRPLPLALDALRRGGHERVKLSLGHGAKPEKSDAEGEVSKTRAASSGVEPPPLLQASALTEEGSDERDASQGQRSGIVGSASGVSVPTSKEASERKSPDETGVPILPMSQPVPLTSPRVRIESSNMMPRQEPVPMQTAVIPNTQQGGLTYRFSRWGADYTVSVQGQTGGTLLLQPSDTLVAQQLSDQWQSGNPQKWQLAQDGGEGRGQHQQQDHEEDEA